MTARKSRITKSRPSKDIEFLEDRIPPPSMITVGEQMIDKGQDSILSTNMEKAVSIPAS